MVFDVLDEICEAQWSNVMVVQRRTFLDIEVPYEDASPKQRSASGLHRALSDSALPVRWADSDDEPEDFEPALAKSWGSTATPEDPGDNADDLASVDTSLPLIHLDSVVAEASEETSGGESAINDDSESVCSLSTDQEDQEEYEVRIEEDSAQAGEATPEAHASSSWAYALWAPAAMGGVWGYSMQMAVAPEQYYEPFESSAASSSHVESSTAVGRWADCEEDESILPRAAYPEWHPVHTQMQGLGTAGVDQHRPDTLDCLLPHEWTTVIFKSLPIDWTRDSLTELLDAEGFCGEYDFMHVPVKFQDLTNLGYALVNCVSNSSADGVLRYFEGFQVSGGNKLETNWSQPNQGLAAHVERYRDSPMMHISVPEQYKPGLFRDGVRLPFPAPTKNLRAPRVRRQKAEAAR